MKDVQIVTSRSGVKVEKNYRTYIAVACGFRQNDAFSLTPITLSAALTVVTRIEQDSTSEKHDLVVEAVADLLSHWHRNGHEMEQMLSSDKFLAGELRMDGGSARMLDQNTKTWQDTIQFSIRGAEKIPTPNVYEQN